MVVARRHGQARGRITADSFRSLTARLRKETYTAPSAPFGEVPWLQIPDIFEPPIAAELTGQPEAQAAAPLLGDVASSETSAPQAAGLAGVAPPLPVLPPATTDAPTALDVEADADDSPAFDIAIPSFVPLPRAELGEPVEAAAPRSEVEDIDLWPIEFGDSPQPAAESLGAEWSAAAAGVPQSVEPESETRTEAEVASFAEHATPAIEPAVETVAEPAPALVDVSAPELALTAPDVPDVEPRPSGLVIEAEASPEPLSKDDHTQSDNAPEELAPVAAVPEVATAVQAEAADVPPLVSEPEAPPADDGQVALQALTRAIYSRPTSGERAAFLREMAALLVNEAEAVSPESAPPPLAVEPVEPVAAAVEPQAAEPLANSLVGRLGPHQTLLRKIESQPSDPFAKTATEAIRLSPNKMVGDEEAGAHALSLLDMMAATGGAAQPQERALAADTLLRLIPRVPAKQLTAVVERMAIMERPPQLVLAKLIRDPRAEIVAPLVERCSGISDQDLIAAAAEGNVAKRRMIARRRAVSALLSDHLIATADPSVLLTLIRNPGAVFSHEAYYMLADQAAGNSSLLAPLTTRNDLPAPVAFELFWHLPSELRRFVLSRFLTDSETLNKILKITRAADDGAEEARFASRDALQKVIDTAYRGHLDQAAELLAQAAGIDSATALRILSDAEGEALAVALKAAGLQRGRLGEALAALKSPGSGVLRPDRNSSELEGIFDTLSFNKARILLTYWDWFVLKKGPYAPTH